MSAYQGAMQKIVRKWLLLALLVTVAGVLYWQMQWRCGRDCVLQAPHRLGKAELERWLAAGFAAGKPITFLSNFGVGICCDVGNTSVELKPDKSIRIFIDGFAGMEFGGMYRIEGDGKLAIISADDNAMRAEYLSSKGIRDAYVFRDRAAIYLVQDSNSRPDFSAESKWPWLWPFKYVPDKTGFW